MGNKILFLGDVVGGPGRKAVGQALVDLNKRFEPDLIIVNGENSAGGVGITPETARELLEYGVDVITTGNHVWKKKEIIPYIEKFD
ncbi:MAG: YmdB family metallophosphoesterase, partial [Deltaproteobacteria bacterium]|nr:YmdB family metallophosphoesterase [Deltaproteobacteria bacterium]